MVTVASAKVIPVVIYLHGTNSINITVAIKRLTVCVLKRLFLLRRFRDDFDSSALERTDVSSVAVQSSYGQRKVFPLVRVGDVQRLCGAVVL